MWVGKISAQARWSYISRGGRRQRSPEGLGLPARRQGPAACPREGKDPEKKAPRARVCPREGRDPGFAREKAGTREKTAPKAWVCPREGMDPGIAREKALGFAREKAGTLGLPARRQGPDCCPPRGRRPREGGDPEQKGLNARVCPREGRDPGFAREKAGTRDTIARGLGFAREKAGTLGFAREEAGT